MFRYRSFEFVLGWPDGEWIGNMLLIGHKEARLIYSYDFDKTYKQKKITIQPDIINHNKATSTIS